MVPDMAGQRLSVEQYVQVLNAFDRQIAAPAAEELEGMTSIETSKRTLDDYFSPEAIRLLKIFCTTSNAGDGGSHPNDQRKWIAFLLHVHAGGEKVDCDTFGACLSDTKWWPDDQIEVLVCQYDFAMQVLRQANGLA